MHSGDDDVLRDLRYLRSLQAQGIADEESSGSLLDPNEQISRGLLDLTLEVAPTDVSMAVRVCAIPPWFDADILGLLVETDEEESVALVERIAELSFVLPRRGGGYVYHAGTRERLLDWWQTPENRDRFYALRRRLANKRPRVLVVHGHDIGAKEAAARCLEKLGLEAVILHEQPSGGRTIIEKFEDYAGVAFAVVLLTPDDVGAARFDAGNLKDRARQNVILELGFFLGRLGRGRVCALHKGLIEIPSDYHGVLWVRMDEAGHWRFKLALEMKAAGLAVDVNRLLG